jgi:hypothetical protein
VIEKIDFASSYVYSPAGLGEVCARSRRLCALLKAGDEHFLVRYANRVHQQASETTQLAGFFLAEDVLVPVPGSSPGAGGLWVAADLAEALVGVGLGAGTWAGLRRIRAVRKSGTAPPGARPSVERHYESFSVDRPPRELRSVVLIDDVVTRGRTLLAAAARVRDVLPGARIRGFALLRTLGLAPDVRRLLNPCIGEIRWVRGDARRIP